MRHRRRYLLAIEPSIDAMAVQAHLSFKPSRILVAIAHGVPLHLLSTGSGRNGDRSLRITVVGMSREHLSRRYSNVFLCVGVSYASSSAPVKGRHTSRTGKFG